MPTKDAATTYLTRHGPYWNLSCLAKVVSGEELQKTTASLLTRFSGYYARGTPWRDLPPEYGRWGTVHQRFIRWRDRRIWEKILEALIEEPDFEWLIIDASHCKVHPHAAGAKGGNQGMERTKGGSTVKFIWPWMRMVCQSELLSQRVPQRIARKRQP